MKRQKPVLTQKKEIIKKEVKSHTYLLVPSVYITQHIKHMRTWRRRCLLFIKPAVLCLVVHVRTEVRSNQNQQLCFRWNSW